MTTWRKREASEVPPVSPDAVLYEDGRYLIYDAYHDSGSYRWRFAKKPRKHLVVFIEYGVRPKPGAAIPILSSWASS